MDANCDPGDNDAVVVEKDLFGDVTNARTGESETTDHRTKAYGDDVIDAKGAFDDVTGNDDVTEHDTRTEEESMDIDEEEREATTDAKMFGFLSGRGKREEKAGVLPTVSQEQDDYDMTNKYRGFALLINNEKFRKNLREMGLGNRSGTQVDEENLKRELFDLGFRVKTINDSTAQSMKDACYEMAARDHSKNDCFVCVILSHGDEGVVYGTDTTIEIKDLAKPFRGDMCPTLVGKPKIFIIQACRGYQTDHGIGVDVMDAKGEASTDIEVPEPNIIKLPTDADFLFAYSTVPGYYSWRNGINGSWFIQALCQTLREHGKKLEFRKILTLTNKKVAQNFQSHNPENVDFHKMKQIPCITTMLTKDLYFNTRKARRLP